VSEQHEESLDATNSIAHVIETGDTEEVAMILGNRERIRCAGIVRPGVKVPKKSCTEKELAIFKRMEAEGYGYDDIDVAMGGKPKSKDSKLFPSNSDYFVVRDVDFKKPSDAQYIRDHYADPDGKVRRIPVWFTVGEIDRVLPHNFKAFDGSGSVRCASFYDGKKLKFKYLPKDLKGPTKAEDWKVLDTDDEEKASKACGYKVTFGGMYRVNVVGLRGLEEVIVPTKSWYGLGYSVATLRRTRSVLGRFDGLVNGQPLFELCKVPEEVITPDGKKQKQWIVTLELSCDPMELARYAEPQAIAARSAEALSLLTGRRAPVSEQPPAEPIATAHVEPPPPVAPAEDFDRVAAINAVVSLVTANGIGERAIGIYAASQGMGEDLSTMDKAGMTDLYKHVRAAMKEDAEAFVAMVKDIAGIDAGGDDEPF
jgi:hypothetical protein